jgi:hypothetical protein
MSESNLNMDQYLKLENVVELGPGQNNWLEDRYIPGSGRVSVSISNHTGRPRTFKILIEEVTDCSPQK